MFPGAVMTGSTRPQRCPPAQGKATALNMSVSEHLSSITFAALLSWSRYEFRYRNVIVPGIDDHPCCPRAGAGNRANRSFIVEKPSPALSSG
jgi:hypothetical protein